MRKLIPAAILAVTATAIGAEETRQLGAHEHGVGQLNLAFDGDRIAMELHAPGADIVGFEYAAESAEDREAVDEAVATLARPLALFALPTAAGCSVVQASASLESEKAHNELGHEDHGQGDDHKHEDHAEHKDEHEHENHAEHEDEPGHEKHAEEAGHTEFHAEYLLDCADTSQVTLIEFPYFKTFPNARELEVQVISDRGANAFEVERDSPTLDLRGMF